MKALRGLCLLLSAITAADAAAAAVPHQDRDEHRAEFQEHARRLPEDPSARTFHARLSSLQSNVIASGQQAADDLRARGDAIGDQILAAAPEADLRKRQTNGNSTNSAVVVTETSTASGANTVVTVITSVTPGQTQTSPTQTPSQPTSSSSLPVASSTPTPSSSPSTSPSSTSLPTSSTPVPVVSPSFVSLSPGPSGTPSTAPVPVPSPTQATSFASSPGQASSPTGVGLNPVGTGSTLSAVSSTATSILIPIQQTTTNSAGQIQTSQGFSTSPVTAVVPVVNTFTDSRGQTSIATTSVPAIVFSTTDRSGRPVATTAPLPTAGPVLSSAHASSGASAVFGVDVTTTDQFGNSIVFSNAMDGQVLTTTDVHGITITTTYHPAGSAVRSVVDITSTLPNGQPSVIEETVVVVPTANGQATAAAATTTHGTTAKPSLQGNHARGLEYNPCGLVAGALGLAAFVL